VRVLDGGLASELERRGADLSDPLWSARVLLEDPDLIRSVHEAYVAAGADVLISASYQASVEGFERRGLTTAEGMALIRRSVALAREAAAARAGTQVAGSIGPYGAALANGSEYRGHYGVGRNRLAGFHRPRLEALVDAEPDILAIETCPSPDEAGLVLRLLEDLPPVPAWVSYSCRDGGHVSEGQTIEEAIRAVDGHPRLMAIGVNCVAPAHVDELLARMRNTTGLPLVVYPNAGERWDATARRWVDPSRPFDPATDAPRWRDAGAAFIGGCCRTTPATIAALREALA
jgi:homocysteine S-methyltransferase